jgi:hypothetical protein
MAGTTRLELATSAVTVQRPEVTSCNFTAPIATFGAPRNPQEFLLHPNCTQILGVNSKTAQITSGLPMIRVKFRHTVNTRALPNSPLAHPLYR